MAVKEIKSLHKAVDILETLQRADGCRLADLHRITRIPKATLLRAIRTLESRNLIRRSLADGRYRTNIALPGETVGAAAETRPLRHGLLVTAATVEMARFARDVPWPSDLFVRNGLVLELLETSRSRTPLLVNRRAIGDRVHFPVSAVGRAYLAFCPVSERDEILAGIEAEPNRYAPYSIRRESLIKDLAETRRLGYGLREARFVGATVADRLLTDHLLAIAVPVLGPSGVHACINMLWPKSAFAIDDFVANHLDDLQAAADRIAKKL
ncbi:MAG: helix-turn-helix domain-containing protein [Proteobacteria bacterium]|nr:helix-turn-helix domain-containing protein [Pseudomonadota bacterium]